MEGGLGGVGGIVGGGDVFSGSGYCNNIPSTSFNLLLGSCRLGIEELVFATLQLPSMKTINTEQVNFVCATDFCTDITTFLWYCTTVA